MAISVLLAEALVGYYLFHRHHQESAFVRAVNSVTHRNFSKPTKNAPISTDTDNVFLSPRYGEKNVLGSLYHPFIGFTSPGHDKYDVNDDYFGFRNKEDSYFKDDNRTTVVITGGSEARGFAHVTTIAEVIKEESR